MKKYLVSGKDLPRTRRPIVGGLAAYLQKMITSNNNNNNNTIINKNPPYPLGQEPG